MGNWSADELSDTQISFAARNVMAVLDVFCSIYANRFAISIVFGPLRYKIFFLLMTFLFLNT